jgi:S1-C subfamily serine protease
MANVLTQLSDDLANAVETAGASVVRVEGRRRMAASGIVWSADGTIITANHVVQSDDKINVGLADGQSASARLVGRDPSTDVALLKVDGAGLSPASRAGSELKVGHLALALGRPGRTVQATLGVISALGEGWRTQMGGQIDRYLQTDVVMYPGFSGGPLVNTAGEIIALNSSALARGVSLSIPVATLERVAAGLQKHGKMRRGYLGVSTQPVRLPEAAQNETGQETGLLITAVEPDSPADQGGLVLGDTIVSVDGVAVRGHDDLLAQLGGDRVGNKTPVTILRGGQLQSINLTIGERQ